MKIERIETTVYRLSLPTPVQAASTGVMSEFDMVMSRITDSDGATGCGYTVLFPGQGGAIASIIENGFGDILHGADPRRIESKHELLHLVMRNTQ